MHISTMQRYARILVIVCVFLCLTLNYTFPIHKVPSDVIPFGIYYNGHHNQCENLKTHNYETNQLLKRSSISANLKGSKKTKHSTTENKQNDAAKSIENIIKNIDLRQYEQLVIMKKYPYLDIKELEMKYRPSGKTVRNSLSFESGLGIENDPGICEQREDLLNVEISNRGLSGFAIPVLPLKQNLNSKHDPKNTIAKSKNIHRDREPDKYKLESLKQKLLSYLDEAMELKCKVQNYEWGKLGRDSKVAKLSASGNPEMSIEFDKPYAELWMGTHPNGPAHIIERGILLSEYLKDNLDAIGPEVRKKFGVTVPFLMKILSVRKALSIQAHPNKEHAEKLHKSFPDMYKDPNHKPELAIALTPFEALCGFRPIVQIKKFLKKLPELTELLPEQIVQNLLSHEGQVGTEGLLKQVFQSLMTLEKGVSSQGLLNLMDRLGKEDPSVQTMLLYPLLQKLHADFPGDIGCWAPYFMNYMELRPGQAIFLKPNLPHAYISGDCVECMACSDNVVRAGLTPKHIDVPTLVEMLDYTSYAPVDLLFTPDMEDENSCIWRPPVEDFAVVKIRVESGAYNTIVRHSPSILIVTSGVGEACDTEPIQVKPGTVLFLKASRQLTLTPAEGKHIEAYQAICNV